MLGSEQHRVLYIDLSSQKSEVKVHSNYYQSLGGVGLATSLYYDLIEQDPVIFSIGPFTGLLPFTASTCCVFRSPLTGGLGESYSGGWLGAVMRFAGHDAIVITGKAASPIYLSIRDDVVAFQDAEKVWGLGTSEATRALRETEGLPGKRSVLVVGPAGERGVAYASAVVDEVYSFQRMGLGARLGRSLLKGVIVSGTTSLEIKEPSRFEGIHSQMRRALSNSQEECLYPGFRLSAGLTGLDEEQLVGGLPSKNLLSNRFDFPQTQATIMASAGVRPMASFGVPLPDQYVYHSAEGGIVPLTYDGIVGLGSVLGCTNLQDILSLIDLAWQGGLDPISLSWTLAHITEEQNLTFGHTDSYRRLIHGLIDQKEEWAVKYGKGLAWATQGQSPPSALYLNGLEMALYFNGYATLLSQLTSSSGNLQDSEGDRIDLSLRGSAFDDSALIQHLIERSEVSSLLNSLMIDYPARGLYADESFLFSILQALGYSFTKEDLALLPKKLLHLRGEIAQYHGKNFDQALPLSERLFSTPSACGMLKEERLRKMLATFRELSENRE